MSLEILMMFVASFKCFGAVFLKVRKGGIDMLDFSCFGTSYEFCSSGGN